MSTTPAAFKVSFPEFGTVDDSAIQRFIDEATACVSATAWGARADTGICYLTAHLLAAFGPNSSSAGSGAITSKRVDGIAASFSYSKNQSGDHSSTKYGRRFDVLRSMIFAGRCL